MLYHFLLALACSSAVSALDPLVTEDGFGLAFSGESDPSVSSVTIDGASVSGSAEKGGFKLSFVGEDTLTIGNNLLANGAIEDSTGWSFKDSAAFNEGSGRDGGLAICITPGGRAYQSIKFSSDENNIFGFRISGWSKADNANGEPDSGYSLYMDVAYADGTRYYGLSVNFDVGTHDYQYKEGYFELTKPVSKASFYLMYRKDHTTGSACFDDISVEPYSAPVVSTGSIKKTSDKLYTQVSTVHDSKLTAEFKAEKSHVKVSGTLENTMSGTPDRAISVSFSIPVDTSDGWMWGSGIEIENITNSGAVAAYRNSASSTGLPYIIDKIPVAGISSAAAGIGIGIKLGSVFAYRLSFGGIQRHLTITMEFSLTSAARTANSAWFEFVLFRLDHPSAADPFRSALDKYCKSVHAEPYTSRVIRDQGLWMPFDPIEEIEGWEDFGFRFFEGQRKKSLIFNTQNGVLNYPYIEPTITHHEFLGASPADTVEKLKACTTAECNVTLTSYIADENGDIRYYEENADWNTGCRTPVNSNPGVPGDTNMAKYILSDVDTYYGMESDNITLAGIYVDSLESFGKTLDYRRELFNILGATPIYDRNRKPCTLFAAWSFDFMGSLAERVRSKKSGSTIMSNGIFNYVPHMALYSDVSGVETTWLRDGVYSPLGHDKMVFYRLNSFKKPFLFLQNSNFRKWTYEMTQKYMEFSLLYGIWPGFFSADAATDRYFDNPEVYNRDRPLFRRYVPYFRLVTKQGWEPMACVSRAMVSGAGNATFYAERWGGSKGSDGSADYVIPFYITARVEGADKSAVKYNVSMDLGCMGWEDYKSVTFDVKEILQTNSTVVKDGKLEFAFSFEKNTTYVFRVDYATFSSGSGSKGGEESGAAGKVAAPFFVLACILILLI